MIDEIDSHRNDVELLSNFSNYILVFGQVRSNLWERGRGAEWERRLSMPNAQCPMPDAQCPMPDFFP